MKRVYNYHLIKGNLKKRNSLDKTKAKKKNGKKKMLGSHIFICFTNNNKV